MQKSENSPGSEPQDNSRLSLYQILQSHRQNAERNFWGRIQTTHAIQAVIITGGFVLINQNTPKVMAIATFILGAFLTLLLGVLSYNDWSDANANKETMCGLEKELHINRTSGRSGIRGFLRSHLVQYYIIGGFLVFDILLAILVCIGVILPK